jgi:hypothetical protein
MLHSHLTTLNAVSLILNTFKDEGLSSEALLAGSGISAADLNRADTRITTNQEMQVCANAVALKHDIGLELGRRMHVSCYGMLGYALLTSATFGDALRLAMRYPALLGTLFELSLEDDGERVWFVAADYRESPAMAVFNAEFCLVSLKVICDDLLGHPLPLLARALNMPRRIIATVMPSTSPARCTSPPRTTPSPSTGAGSINRCHWPTASPIRPWPNAAASRTSSSPDARRGWGGFASCSAPSSMQRRAWRAGSR